MLHIKQWLVLLLTLYGGVAVSQSTGQPTPSPFLTNLVQPSPNAGSLGKYADYPVSYYTGLPQISVPIYNLKDGGIQVPINLSYHASGIRVSELASWVGLGWSLNAGGLITRTVRGIPDEGGTDGGGYYRAKGLSTFAALPDASHGSPDAGSTNNFHSYFLGQLSSNRIDGEPDLYTFNFNGYVGKFVFDENQNVHLLNDDNLKITPLSSTGEADTFDSWLITTPDGIQYYFGENGMVEQTRPYSTSSGLDENTRKPSSWYLTRIVNPNTKDVVTFTYENEVYGYMDLGVEIASNTDPVQLNGTVITRNYLYTSVSGQRLTAITSKNFNIQFVKSKDTRTDLTSARYYFQNLNTAYYLDGIKIYNNQQVCIKSFVLDHNYFSAPVNSTYPDVITGMNSAGYNNEASDTKRLKFTSIKECTGDGSECKPPYLISYNESVTMPRRLSYDQDHWGYLNGPGSNNRWFTPTYDTPAGQGGGGAYRTSSWPLMSALCLDHITDPLGAVTQFQFEANKFDDGFVGGLRINQITVTDNVRNTSTVRKFNYGNSGQLFSQPQYFLMANNEFYFDGSTKAYNTSNVVAYQGYYSATVYGAYIRQSQSVVPLQNAQGNHIGYAQVTESFGANGEGGSCVYEYQPSRDRYQLNSRLDIKNYTDSYTYGMKTGLYGNGIFNGIAPESLIYATDVGGNDKYLSVDFYPGVPLQEDVTAGKLLTKTVLDASGNTMERIENTYTPVYHENFLIRGMKTYQTTVTMQQPPNNVLWYDAISYYKLHTGTAQLSSTVKKTFKGLNSYLTETTTYKYESPFHTLPTEVTTTNSKGEVLTKKTYYTFDYQKAGSTYQQLKDQNILLPIADYTWKGALLAGAKVTEIVDFGSGSAGPSLYPANIYVMESKGPLTETQAGISKTFSSPTNVLYPDNSIYFKQRASFIYDGNTGNLINQQLNGGSSQGIQWNNQFKLPEAIVSNASNGASTITSVYNSANSLVMGRNSTYAQTFSLSFEVKENGTTSITIGFTGNPGTNALAQVSCMLNGPSNSGSIPLCAATGTANSNCSGYGSTKTFSNLAKGTYTLTAQFYQTQNLNSDVSLSVSYPTTVNTNNSAGSTEFYYNGYENDPYVGTVTNAHTGNKAYVTNNCYVNWTGLPRTNGYTLTYWYRVNGIWQLKKQDYTGPVTLQEPNADAYDDIRICPKDAQMLTYTYDAQGNVTSSTDAKNYTTYYDYDSFYRLLRIKDQNGNVLKEFTYHYTN